MKKNERIRFQMKMQKGKTGAQEEEMLFKVLIFEGANGVNTVAKQTLAS